MVKNLAGIIIRREWRNEKGLFFLSTITIAAASAALTAVLLLADTFERNRLQQAKVLLGGDISLRLSQREFSSKERAWLADNTANTSELRIARMLAIADGQTHLVRLKGIDNHYPLFGKIDLQDDTKAQAIFANPANTTDNAIPALVDKSLLTLLGLQINGLFQTGGLTLRAVGIVNREPDPDPRLWAGAPVVFIDKSAMESENFMRPGTLISRFFRVVLPPQTTPEQWKQRLDDEFPDAGWRTRTPDEAQSGARRIVARIRDFLALAALAAILVAGIGCGNAVSAFLRTRIRAVAVIKMLGGNGALIRRVYLLLPAALAISGAVVGVVIGSVVLFAVAPLLSLYLPWSISPIWSATVVVRALLTTILLTAAFAIPPVLRFARTNPIALFASGGDDAAAPPPDKTDRLTTSVAFGLAAIALPLAWDKKILLAAVVGVAGLLYLAALGVARLAERLKQQGGIAWRLGMLTVARNRYQTATGVMSFGIGIFVLTAVLNTEANFTKRIDDTLEKTAPSLYFIGALPNQANRLTMLIQEHDGNIRSIPFVRGRIEAIGGRASEEIAKTAPDGEKWILRGDRGLTWSDGAYIGASRVTEGVLWDETVGGLQASFDDEAATAFGISLGDTLQLNVFGQQVTAVISSFRTIDWQSFDINFVVILSAPPFADIPHTRMGTAFLPPDKIDAVQLAIGKTLPNITPIATQPIFSALKNLLALSAALLQSMALFLLLAGVPMIVATLMENRRRRLQNATVLRLLGTPRRTIVISGIAEFLVMAALAVLPAILFGVAGGYLIVTEIFELSWQPHWRTALFIGAASTAAFLALGATDIARAVKNAPYPALRNE